MKKLNKFTYFDFEGFSDGKRYKTIGQQPWKDFETGKELGSKIEVVIVQDKTDYGNQEGEVVNNLYEKLTFKVAKKVSVPMDVEVRPINAEAVVYGEYRNQISITAEDIVIANKKEA